MPERTIEVRPIPDRPPGDATSAPRRGSALSVIRGHPWVATGIALLALSTLLVVWARTRPGYDPFGPDGANLNLIIGNAAIDPISGSVPHRSYLCEISRVEG